MNHQKFKVRVVDDNCNVTLIENLSWSDAIDRFLFYVHCALELGVHLRCVNIIIGKKTIRMFSNHSY